MGKAKQVHRVSKCSLIGVGKCQGKGWHVETYHGPTGQPLERQHTPWFPTRREAVAHRKTMIDWRCTLHPMTFPNRPAQQRRVCCHAYELQLDAAGIPVEESA
jgi:hypothetical protein